MAAWKKKRVREWLDGDTPKFTDGIIARLARVRCQERHQFGGSTATRTAAGMSGRGKGFVYVKQIARDAYGRPLIEMKNKDGSINSRMLKKGYRNKGR
jgi:endonuclease YncB( thermonuclease family)